MVSGNFTRRNLSKADLGGVIFGCTHDTMKESLVNQIFGLPGQHMSYVQNIEPGLPLFLFNYSERKLYGIFEAESRGQLNINPYGWSTSGSDKTKFPAQVRIRTRMQCEPLLEKQFKPIILRNYHTPKLFWFEVDHTQANALLALFGSSPVTAGSAKWIPRVGPNFDSALEVNHSAAPVSMADFSWSDQLTTRREVSSDLYEEENEEQAIYQKLEQLALERKQSNSSELGTGGEASVPSDTNAVEVEVAGAPETLAGVENKNEETSTSDVQAVIHQGVKMHPSLSTSSSSSENEGFVDLSNLAPQRKPRRVTSRKKNNGDTASSSSPPDKLIGRIPVLEAKIRWPRRYQKDGGEDNQAKAHYEKALVDGMEFKLYDCARLKVISPEIVERLKHVYNEKRVFYSKDKDDNSLDCLVKNITIEFVAPKVTPIQIPKKCDFYCDMGYIETFSTFCNLTTDFFSKDEEIPSFCEASCTTARSSVCESSGASSLKFQNKREMKLLDVFSGCGAMSTGLCMGAAEAGVNLVTKWALDFNEAAYISLRHNHPEAKVRNESAADFLSLLKEWVILCEKFLLKLQLCKWQSPCQMRTEKMLRMIIRNQRKYLLWSGFWIFVMVTSMTLRSPAYISSDCPEKVKEFVINGRLKNILPLPGDADIICGGPPCQGISGFNRFRNYAAPLEDEKNEQLQVFINIIEHLKPKCVLMENVVDILKFVDGFLGKYAIGSLVCMNYQVRQGLLAAGCYGLPQFRMRAFFWGALISENLPAFPRPTHMVKIRNHAPKKFENNLVPYELEPLFVLSPALVLKDVISDLPSVDNAENRDEMPCLGDALTLWI